jgi:hypothetical protein
MPSGSCVHSPFSDLKILLTLFLDSLRHNRNVYIFLLSSFQPPLPNLRHGRLLGYYVGYKAANASSEPFRYQTLEANDTSDAIADFASQVSLTAAAQVTVVRDAQHGNAIVAAAEACSRSHIRIRRNT